MTKMSDRVRTALYIEKSLLQIADANLKKANCRSRNEFINQALRHYIAFLQKETDNEFLTPALESLLSETIGDSENRVARILFKFAVELSMVLHVTASELKMDERELAELRHTCIDEVLKLNGDISLEKAHDFQKK